MQGGGDVESHAAKWLKVATCNNSQRVDLKSGYKQRTRLMREKKNLKVIGGQRGRDGGEADNLCDSVSLWNRTDQPPSSVQDTIHSVLVLKYIINRLLVMAEGQFKGQEEER